MNNEYKDNIEENYEPEEEEFTLPKPRDLSLDYTTKYMTDNERIAIDILDKLISQGYTEITNENILQWKDILGEDLAIHAHKLGGMNMLPEQRELINLTSKTRSIIISQLVVFAELLKGINASNDLTVQTLQEKHITKIQESIEDLYNNLQSKVSSIRNKLDDDNKAFTIALNKSRSEITDILIQSENVKNGIEKAQENTLKIIESKIQDLFEKNLAKASSSIGKRVGAELKTLQEKEIDMKTKMFYIGASSITLVIGLILGKFIL